MRKFEEAPYTVLAEQEGLGEMHDLHELYLANTIFCICVLLVSVYRAVSAERT